VASNSEAMTSAVALPIGTAVPKDVAFETKLAVIELLSVHPKSSLAHGNVQFGTLQLTKHPITDYPLFRPPTNLKASRRRRRFDQSSSLQSDCT
jgi:hypothetical protein